MELGEKLARARKYQQPAIGQRELAALVGVATSTVGRWESRNDVPQAKLIEISRKLGIPLEWFTDGRDTPPPDSPNAQEIAQTHNLGPADRSLRHGDEVALPVWRGVLAGDGECEFYESSSVEFANIPSFLAGNNPEAHIVCIATGASMFPRIRHGERAVIRIDSHPPVNTIVVAHRPDGAHFIKVLREDSITGMLSLESLNPEFRPIHDLESWILRGFAVAILHSYEPGEPNIEWDNGRALRAPRRVGVH